MSAKFVTGKIDELVREWAREIVGIGASQSHFHRNDVDMGRLGLGICNQFDAVVMSDGVWWASNVLY